MVAERARSNGAAFALCNTVGGQDELVFDGAQRRGRRPTARRWPAPRQFEPELLADLRPGDPPGAAGRRRGRKRTPSRLADREEAEVYGALRLGCATTCEKNGFEHVVIGLSRGIDSALVALIAADALGAERVSVVVMPSPNSSDETQADARTIAANLGVELIEIPIAEAMGAYEEALAPSFEGTEPGSPRRTCRPGSAATW